MSCGRDVTAAIASISSAEVLLARMAPGLAILSSCVKTPLLTAMCFEHGFDNQISVAQFGEVSASRDARPARRQFRGLWQRALCAGALIDVIDTGKPARETVSILLNQRDWQLGIGEHHGDAAPMVPAPMTPTAATLRQGVEALMPRTTDAVSKAARR